MLNQPVTDNRQTRSDGRSVGPARRRQFLATCASSLALATVARWVNGQPLQASPNTEAKTFEIDVLDGKSLQSELDQYVGSGNIVRLKSARSIHCVIQEQTIDGERSIHPLLIPAGVHLDLNGSTLELDLRSNSYGVRLSNRSSIRNGSIKIVRSEGKGSQSCWHSGISVGAAYGDGGTPEKPGRFSAVRDWAIENMTVDQPFAASAIQLMSEACHGLIRNVRVLDSDQALIGVGMDWGSVGPMTSEDAEIPRMRQLWEMGKIYSTHPHDVLVENLEVGQLRQNVDANDAAVRCSACHNITIRNVKVSDASTAIAIFGGDLGYEFARADQREFQHTGYRIENVTIDRAWIYGLVLNGSADNVYRAVRNHGYHALRDPVHPGLVRPMIKNLTLRGGGERQNRQGIYAVALTDARLESIQVKNFDIGVHVEDWVQGMQFEDMHFAMNRRDTQIEGATEPATGVTFGSM